MSKSLKWIIGILVAVVLLLVVLSATGVFGKSEGTEVTAEAAQSRTITETVNASGKVFPEVEVKVSPDISGEITELAVNEGDTVRKGQVLARIYADIYNSQRDQAAAMVSQSEAQVANSRSQLGALQAALDAAKSTYDRQKTLLDQKVISRAEFETAQQTYLSAKANLSAAQQGIRANQAGVQSAQASLSRASKDVSRATIVAPMDGVISLMLVKKGERVVGTAQMAGTEMMRIADLNSMEVQVDVGENDIPKVKLGDSALVEVDAFNNRKFRGVVYKIANPYAAQAGAAATTASTSSSTTVTNYQVHIRLLPDSYRDLIVKGQPFPFRPNMTASADIQTKTHTNVLSVPLNAVTTRDSKGEASAGAKDNRQVGNQNNQPNDQKSPGQDDLQVVVFVVQPGDTVRRVSVKTDIQDINNIEITSGLKAGDKVVTGPYDVVSKVLHQGQRVKIVDKDKVLKDFKKK